MKLFNSEATTVEKTKHLSPLGEKQSLHYYAVSRAPIGKWSPQQKNLVAPPPPPPSQKKKINLKTLVLVGGQFMLHHMIV